MGMPRGLAKATGYWNTVEAWRDWQRLAAEATAQGAGDLVERHRPAEGAGWRRVDKAIAALRAAISARQEEAR